MDVAQRLRNLQVGFRNLGTGPALLYRLKRAYVDTFGRSKPYRLSSRRLTHPVLCRPGTSDIDVFSQIFVGREYRCLDDVRDAGLIIDCGANVGYSSAYFLTQYPAAQVIAVEPDTANCAMLRQNLAAFGERARVIESAVWSDVVGLRISEAVFGDGREWSRTVRPVRNDETATMTGVDIETLRRESGFDRISILKIDVEGAETEIFTRNYEAWLSKVDNLVIELHGPECEAVFRNAVSNNLFDFSTCDELTVCKRNMR